MENVAKIKFNYGREVWEIYVPDPTGKNERGIKLLRENIQDSLKQAKRICKARNLDWEVYC